MDCGWEVGRKRKEESEKAEVSEKAVEVIEFEKF